MKTPRQTLAFVSFAFRDAQSDDSEIEWTRDFPFPWGPEVLLPGLKYKRNSSVKLKLSKEERCKDIMQIIKFILMMTALPKI